MSDFLRIFEAKALAEELTKAGHSVSERTAQRWKAGVTKPKPQDIRAIRKLVGATLPNAKKPRPEWAEAMSAEILGGLEKNRQLTEALALPADLVETTRRVISLLEVLEPPVVEVTDDPVEGEAPAGGSPQAPGSGSPPNRTVRR